MNTRALIDALGNIDGDIIEEYFNMDRAIAATSAKRRSLIRWGAVAACLLLTLTVTLITLPRILPTDPTTGGVGINPGTPPTGGVDTSPPATGGTACIDSVIWDKNYGAVGDAVGGTGGEDEPEYGDGTVGGEPQEPYGWNRINGIRVNDALYNMLTKGEKGPFGIVVYSSREDYDTAEALARLSALGIYGEIYKSRLFIFPTYEEFVNMALTDAEKDEFRFVLAGKSLFTSSKHLDNDDNGRCDLCDELLPHAMHNDGNGDDVCDICRSEIK